MLPSLSDAAATRIGVRPLKCGKQLVERELVVSQFGQIGIDLILLDGAAHRHDVRHTLYLAHLLFDHPILIGAQFLRRVVVTAQPEPENFADGRGQRREVGLDAGRQVDPAQPFDHLRTDQLVARLVVEREDDERETELRVRKTAHHIRDGGQRRFDRNRNLALHFFCGMPRIQGNHIDLGVGHVGKRLDRQIDERNKAGDDKHESAQQHKQRLPQRIFDQTAHAYFLTSGAPASAASARIPAAASICWR